MATDSDRIWYETRLSLLSKLHLEKQLDDVQEVLRCSVDQSPGLMRPHAHRPCTFRTSEKDPTRACLCISLPPAHPLISFPLLPWIPKQGKRPGTGTSDRKSALRKRSSSSFPSCPLRSLPYRLRRHCRSSSMQALLRKRRGV